MLVPGSILWEIWRESDLVLRLLKLFLTATHGHLSFGGGFELMRDGDTEQLLPNISRSL